MKKSIKTQRFHIFEHIKTAILSGLVICMLVLVVIYIGGTGVYENAVSDGNIGESFEKLWSVQGTAEPIGLEGDNLIPEFIGYKQKNDEYPLGSVGSQSSISVLYGLIKPCILELFGKDSVCRPLSSEDGVARFSAAQTGDEFIYIRYHTPTLYQLIYAYAADKLTVSESDVASGTENNIGAYISDIVIIPDRDFAAHRFIAYATDLKGNYYEFRPEDHFVASSFYISRLAEGGAETDTLNFEFVKMEGSDTLQPMIDGEIGTAVLSYMPAIAGDEKIKNPLLRLFGYNPDKLNFYDDGEETVYVDSGSKLRIGDDIISFTATDASAEKTRGIEIDSLLGYISGESYSLFDKLTAVDNLIRRIREISPYLIGGEEAELCLGDVYTEGSLLVIEYFLTYNSVKIEGTPILRATLTDSTICELEINTVFVYATDLTTYSPRPKYVLRKLYELDKIPSGRAPISVRLRYTGNEAGWNVYLDE